MTRTVSIGGAQGFYGDATEPVTALSAECDYLIMDGLAELTLAILQKQRQRDESAGWAQDLVAHADAFLPAVIQNGLHVITNSGGLNPISAGRALLQRARELGENVRVATIIGDDIRPILHDISDESTDDVRFANAYTGAKPIVEALERGAQIVVAGRVADSALALGPLVHEFGWAWDDWDRLAAGTMTGHLLECTGQASGGNLSWRWWESPEPWKLPFPIAAVDSSGVTELRKVRGSGGMVTVETVREQLLYEIHDPSAYIVPDVVVDLGSVRLEPVGENAVRVSGVIGHAAPSHYKALVCRPAGWTGDISIGLGWPDAPAKAHALAQIICRRAELVGLEVEEWVTEVWGHDALRPGYPTGSEPSEVVLRLAWRCHDRATAEAVGRLVPPLYTSGPVPGITTAGRAFRFDASELFATTSIYIEKDLVDRQTTVEVLG